MQALWDTEIHGFGVPAFAHRKKGSRTLQRNARLGAGANFRPTKKASRRHALANGHEGMGWGRRRP